MAEQTSLNYSELKKIAKTFDDESDALAELLGKTRQMVHDLQDDWMGDAGERFFDEMEGEILPAMERLNHALSFTADTVRKIVKTFDDAEFETVEFFSDGRLERSNAGAELGGLDFGIKDFGNVPIGSGGNSSGIDVGDLDFGIGGTVDTPPPPAGETSPGIDVSDLDFGIGDGSGTPPVGGASGIDVNGLDFGKEALGDVPVDTGGGSGPGTAETSPETASETAAETSSESSASEASSGGGGGGGGSGGSEGLQGDLNGMGTGTSHQATTGGGTAEGSNTEAVPDHVYRSQTPSTAGGGSPATPAGTTASATGGSSPQPAIRTGGGEASGGDSNNLAGIAGALGGIGAAAGGVAKVIKDKKESE